MAPWFTMPDGAQARRSAASSEIAAALTAIRCVLDLLDAALADGTERHLLRVIDDELAQIRRAAEHLGA